MLVAYKWEEKGLYMEYEGILSSTDILRSDQNYGNSKFDDIEYTLINLSLVTEIKYNRSTLKIKAAQSNVASNWNSEMKMVFVVSNEKLRNEVQFYKQEMSKLKENTWDIFITRSIEEARELIANQYIVKTRSELH